MNTPADFTKTWRYKVGFLMIVVGNLGIVGAVLLGMVGQVPQDIHLGSS